MIRPGLVLAATALALPVLALPALAKTPKPAAPDGPRLFAYHCQSCHGIGPGHPGTAALALRDQGTSPAGLADRRDLTADFVTYVVRHGSNAMPFFRKTEISDADLAATAAYLSRKR